MNPIQHLNQHHVFKHADTHKYKYKHTHRHACTPLRLASMRPAQAFLCFLGEDCENIDVDISAVLFGTRGNYFEAVGFGSPMSVDRGVTHMGDSVQPEAGVNGGDLTLTEDIEFDLALVHQRVSSPSR